MRDSVRTAAGMTVVAGGLLLALLLAGSSPVEVPAKFIVQADEATAAAAAARAAGARVERELGIIDAVVVEATKAQRIALASSGNVRRIWDDRQVAVTSGDCPISGEAYLDFDGKKIKWYTTNAGQTDLWLETLSIEWPGSNQRLKKIKFAGHDIYDQLTPPPSLDVNGLWNGDENDRRLEAGKTERFEIEFELDAEPMPGSYALVAGFDGGCEVRFDPAAMSCALSSDMLLDVDGDKIKWALTNDGDHDLWLDDLHVEWPQQNGAIEKIKLNGDVFDDLAPPPVLFLAGLWHGGAGDRRLEADKTKELEIEFEYDATPLVGEYFLQAEFGPGCSLVFRPEQGGGNGVAPPDFNQLVGADQLHLEGVSGSGVTVAIVDTGV